MYPPSAALIFRDAQGLNWVKSNHGRLRQIRSFNEALGGVTYPGKAPRLSASPRPRDAGHEVSLAGPRDASDAAGTATGAQASACADQHSAARAVRVPGSPSDRNIPGPKGFR